MSEISLDKIKINKVWADLTEDRNGEAYAEDQLETSMLIVGQTVPIIVDKELYIFDGHKRFRCAKRLGWKTIKALVING